MIELAAIMAIVACTSGAIAVGVNMGTRYIDQKLNYDLKVSSSEPIVRPSHPSGLEWLSV
jgi:hypothetical protein